MDTFEIHDEEINVEEIMRKIKENIKRRKESGAYQEGELENLCQATNQVTDPKKNDLFNIVDDIQRDLDYINTNWDIQNNSYFISSHRPISGKAIVKGRELVHGEVSRYVDPIIRRQKEFNGCLVRILNKATKRIIEISQKTVELENNAATQARSEISGKVDEQIDLVKSEINGKVDEQIDLVKSEINGKVDEQIDLVKSEISGKVDEQIGLVKSEISGKVDEQIGLVKSEISGKVDEQIGLVKSEISDKIATQVEAVVSAMNQEIENRAWLANILDKKIGSYQGTEPSLSSNQELGLNYFIFEERFRGSRADIKQRQTAFVHYFEGCKNVLDIGCGRGEFLELLRDNGIGGHGIDIDADMADFCTSKSLNVEKIDAISYLERIEDKSLDGIFLDQVVEHLEPDYLIKMLRLCHSKLNFGYYILIETVNPLSLVSFANFYLDMSHKRPIHPETLKFLMASLSFREIETRFFSPIPDESRLRKINVEGVEERNRQPIEVYNHNIDMLNNILYGAQDYAVIGKK